MFYLKEWDSPLGKMRMASDGKHLNGLWFAGQKYDYRPGPEDVFVYGETGEGQADGGKGRTSDVKEAGSRMVFDETEKWMRRYFAGEKLSGKELPLRPQGSDFRRIVWRHLLAVPYGQTTTYGALAKSVAREMGRKTMSAQAVGGAVSHNPISIIIPCHRVLGADGSLTGYAGGLDRKIRLLELEGASVPERGCGLAISRELPYNERS